MPPHAAGAPIEPWPGRRHARVPFGSSAVRKLTSVAGSGASAILLEHRVQFGQGLQRGVGTHAAVRVNDDLALLTGLGVL